MDFQQLKEKTALARQAYRLGTDANHTRQADSFMRFCNNYRLQFIDPVITSHHILAMGGSPPEAKRQTDVNIKGTVKSKAHEGPVPRIHGELAVGL